MDKYPLKSYVLWRETFSMCQASNCIYQLSHPHRHILEHGPKRNANIGEGDGPYLATPRLRKSLHITIPNANMTLFRKCTPRPNMDSNHMNNAFTFLTYRCSAPQTKVSSAYSKSGTKCPPVPTLKLPPHISHKQTSLFW